MLYLKLYFCYGECRSGGPQGNSDHLSTVIMYKRLGTMVLLHFQQVFRVSKVCMCVLRGLVGSTEADYFWLILTTWGDMQQSQYVGALAFFHNRDMVAIIPITRN